MASLPHAVRPEKLMDLALSLDFLKKDMGGVTFVPGGVVIAQQSSGKIKHEYYAPYPSWEGEPPAAFDDIFGVFRGREMELAAFLQKALRDSKLDSRKIVVSLSPKDLIIRFFEMPNIPRAEILAGINFEMKKYIPFKIEELAYDFQYRVKQKANIIEVILCGMKQEALSRYVELFKQMNLDVVAFEPGLFSLFRLLVVKNKISSQHSYVILDFDQQEADILIAEKGFPYFTRDIKLKGPSGPGRVQEDFDAVLFRLINEVRVSLDYFRRQFLRKDVDEMIIVAGKNFSSWADHFSRELGLKVHFVAPQDLFKTKAEHPEFLSGAAKAYGASLRGERPSLVTLNLNRPHEKAAKTGLALPSFAGAEIQEHVLSFLRNSRAAITKGVVAGGVVFAMGYGLGFSKLFPLEKELAAASVKQAPLLPGVDASTLETAQESETVFSEKERELRALIEGYNFFYKKLLVLPRLMPRGIWISGLQYAAWPPSLRLNCFSYSEEETAVSENMNRFVLNLKAEKEISAVFSSVELKSYRETSYEDISYMQFDVQCEK